MIPTTAPKPKRLLPTLAPEKPDAFMRGVMALAAVVFAIILFKRTGVMRCV